uniref:Uncharacterized protein n=1 Tax=Arundo donax TaxID=35708 RepID=A0A0A9DLT9_ARUDO
MKFNKLFYFRIIPVISCHGLYSDSLAGMQAAEAPIRISGVNKRGWKYIKESQKKLQDSPKVEAPVAA